MAVRYYPRRGLLCTPQRPIGGIRRLWRRCGRAAAVRQGFNLDELAQLLRLDDGTHCAKARTLAKVQLRAVRKRLRDLRASIVAALRLGTIWAMSLRKRADVTEFWGSAPSMPFLS